MLSNLHDRTSRSAGLGPIRRPGLWLVGIALACCFAPGDAPAQIDLEELGLVDRHEGDLDPVFRREMTDLLGRVRAGAGLEDPRFGVTLFDSLGNAAAWSGRASVLPSAILNRVYTRESVFAVRDTGAVTELIHLAQLGNSGNAVATEFLVRNRVEPGPPPDLLPSLPSPRRRRT